jgi:hypothetical protein
MDVLAPCQDLATEIANLTAEKAVIEEKLAAAMDLCGVVGTCPPDTQDRVDAAVAVETLHGEEKLFIDRCVHVKHNVGGVPITGEDEPYPQTMEEALAELVDLEGEALQSQKEEGSEEPPTPEEEEGKPPTPEEEG